MKCPKCHYLSFEPEPRCKHCGYSFSLSEPDLALHPAEDSEAEAPLSDFPMRDSEVDRLRTPISLGWGLLGLAAWDLWPSNGTTLVERCLANQSRYGEYDTSALCLLFLGALAGEKGAKTILFSHSSRNQTPAVLTQ